MRRENQSDQLALAANQNIRERDYWLNRLSGQWEKTHIPADYKSIDKKKPVFQSVPLEFTHEQAQLLLKLSNNSDNRLYMILVTGLTALLHKYLQSGDIILGTPIYKQDTDTQFVNTALVLRSRFDAGASFKELLLQVRETIVQAVDHYSYPIEYLPRQLDIPMVEGDDFPLFDIAVLLENIHDARYLGHLKYNLEFSFTRTGETIQGNIRYNELLYDSRTIRRIAQYLSRVWDSVSADIQVPISRVQLLSEEEKKQWLIDFNDTDAGYPEDAVLHRLFSRQAARAPEAVALELDGREMTYRQLDEKSDRLALRLQREGVSTDHIVGLFFQRSVDMIVSIIAILKAGGAYLPIDPQYPVERIKFMLEDSGCRIIIADSSVDPSAAPLKSSHLQTVIHVDDDGDTPENADHFQPAPADPRALAYIIYTSGTTGKPKGVMIDHYNVVRLMFNDRDRFDFGPNDVWTLFHSYCFDFSVWEMYGALLFGGKLIIVPGTVAKDPQLFYRLLKNKQVTVLNQTPSAFYNLVDEALREEKQELALRYVIFGGEALHPVKLEKWWERYPGIKLVNMFGITETTVHVTYKEITGGDIRAGISNIGVPLPTLRTYILGEDLDVPVPGVPGELFVGGDGVARGYLNRPELSADKFIPDPYRPGERLYRSGDLARFTVEGELEYIGRIDHQVQFHGFRIELGEIETRLLRHPEINGAVVIKGGDQKGNDYLCAYYVSDIEISLRDLKDHLSESVPDYMIPAHWVRLEKIPLTPNGKVDRKALPAPQSVAGEDYVPPSNETEEKLAVIWSDVLELERLGTRDSFFNVGGDSIKAVKLVHRINDELGTQLKIADIYQAETIEKLAVQYMTTETSGREREENLTRTRESVIKEIEQLKEKILRQEGDWRQIEDLYPMSDIEKGMISAWLKESHVAVYHEQFVFQLDYADFSMDLFQRAMELMVDKHPILRTGFNMTDYEEPIQLIYRNVPVNIHVEDISQRPRQEQEAYIEDYSIQQRTRLFNEKIPPMWKLHLFLTGRYVVGLWEFHHAILDGWSEALFMTELNNTYRSLKKDPGYVPGLLPGSYKDFVLQEMIMKQEGGAYDFWVNELDDYKRLDVAGTHGGNADIQNIGKRYTYDMEAGFLEQLKQKAREYNSSVKNLCFAAYLYTLYMHTYHDDLVVGLVTNARPPVEGGSEILGCFLNTIPFRFQFPDSIDWPGYIRQLSAKLTGIKQYDGLSLYEIVKAIGEKTGGKNPIFDTLFNFIDFHVFNHMQTGDNPAGDNDTGGGPLAVEGFENTNTLLDVIVSTTYDVFKVIIAYDSSAFSEELIIEYGRNFREILYKIVREPKGLLRKDEFLAPSQKQELLYRFNDTDAAYPEEKTLHQLFREQARRYPDAVALVLDDQQLSYRHVEQESNRLASLLRERGVGPDAITGLLADRSLEAVIGMLGILKAGGAYLPLDPEYPADRIHFMLEDSDTRVLVTSPQWADHVRFDRDIIQIGGPEMKEADPQPLEDINSPGDLAYIIYTSGTTGKPKGVQIEHRNVVRLMFNQKFQFDFGPGDAWTMFHSPCFDFSVWEIYGALLYGGKLVVIPRMVARVPADFLQVLEKHHITVLNQTPSAFYMLIDEIISQNHKNLALRYVVFGGEALAPAKLKPWYALYPGTLLINMFGITETTVHVTYKEIAREEIENNISNIGRPIPTLSTYILDKQLRLLPKGVAGELCVGGAGVSRGYLNRPQLTAAKFIQNPYKEGERLYRSGDLARLLPDGEMEYLGRIDHQVQVRGFRIELGEIEDRLRKHPQVKEAVVLAKTDQNNQTYLCAYIVSASNPTAPELREHLLRSLPDYMIPNYFIQLPSIPLTVNGKVDRKALPEPGQSDDTPADEPRTQLERQLAEIWANELGMENVGINDNYFSIGGDSIKVIKLINRINKKLDIHLKLTDIYYAETIERLAQLIEETEKAVQDEHLTAAETEIRELKEEILGQDKLLRNIEDVYPMSDIEKGMIFAALRGADVSVYFEQFVYQLNYPDFSDALFLKALELLSVKHPILRTTFDMHGFREPVQVVHEDLNIDFLCQDITSKTPEQQEDYISRYIESERTRPFDVVAGPLWRMRVFRVGPAGIVVLWQFHHAILDGWSNASFMTELNNTYRSLAKDPGYTPEPLKNTYKDFIIEQRAESRKEENIKFWVDELEDYKRLHLFDTPGRVQVRNIMKRHTHTVETGFFQNLEQTARKMDSLVKNMCLGAYLYMLSTRSYDNDVVAGLVANNRPQCEDGGKILGCFLNTLPLRMQIPNSVTWRQYQQSVDEKIARLKKYDRLSLFEIVNAIGDKAEDRNPIFDVLFNFVDFHVYGQAELDAPEPGERKSLDIKGFENTNTLFDMTVNTTFGAFEIIIQYDYSVIGDESVTRYIQYFMGVLDKLIHHPDEIASKEALMSPGDKGRLLEELNHIDSQYPQDKTIHRLFADMVSQYPGNTAVVYQEQSLNYAELDRLSSRVALELRESGVEADTIVGIIAQRGLQLIAGILGILKAGGIYMPLDPEYPEERIRFMLDDSRARILLVPDGGETPAHFNGTVIQMNSIEPGPENTPDLSFVSHPSDGAYIIYTSGTTGKPKGVVIEHRNVVRLFFNEHARFDFNPGDVWTMFHSPCFDFSVWEMYGALFYGGTVIVIPRMIARDPSLFHREVSQHNVTILNQTPSAFYNFIEQELLQPEALLKLRYVIFGGEALNPAKLEDWSKRYPSVKLINMYGITETTVHVTYKEITGKEIRDAVSNIGVPIPTLGTYILDKNCELLPVGAVGELCVGGHGVARGYLNRPELSMEKFIPNPFRPGQRLYRSGDLARVLPNGEMEYLGRIDHQVQLRGFRIELGEIETQLLKHENINEALVLDKTGEAGDVYLCAYIVADVKLAVPGIREFLSGLLPDYMIPSYFVQLDTIPLTVHGKADRKALPEPTWNRDEEYIAPRNYFEAKIAHLWEQVLDIQKVGVNLSFFNIGGDSIKAVRLLHLLNKELEIELSIADLYENETVESLAAFTASTRENQWTKQLAEARREIADLREKVFNQSEIPSGVEDVFPMSDIEKGMVFLSRANPEKAVYHEQFVYQMSYENFDPALFQQAIRLMAQKHDILRTGFSLGAWGDLLQVVHREVDIDFQLTDISHLDQKDQESHINNYLVSQREKPFDIARAPLWRMTAFRLSAGRVALLWEFHHAILDGWSNASLTTELNNTYASLKEDAQYKPQILKSTYKDFIIEQAAVKKSTQIADYWMRELDGYKRLDFSRVGEPGDGRPGVLRLEKQLDASMLADLENAARQNDTTIKNLCFAAYLYMLGLLSHENDITAGLVTNNRPVCEDGDKIIGCFLNSIPFRISIPDDITWAGYLREVGQKVTQLKKYERLPLFDIAKLIGERPDAGNPIFDTVFNYIDFYVYGQAQLEEPQEKQEQDALALDNYENTDLPFSLSVGTTLGHLNVILAYDPSILHHRTVDMLFHRFRDILTRFIETPNDTLRKDSIIPEQEKHRLLYRFNTTQTLVTGGQTLPELFARQVRETPDSTAVVCGGEKLSYARLDQLSHQLARRLREKGVGPGKVAAVMVGRQLEMAVAVLGVLKSGGIFLPVDPASPVDRLEYLQKDSCAEVLVTNRDVSFNVFPHIVHPVEDSDKTGEITNFEPLSQPSDVAYIIYTSGTTGRPKGVAVEHRGAVNTLICRQEAYRFGNNDVSLQLFPYWFDGFITSFFSPIIAGASVVLPDDEEILDIRKIARLITRYRITTFICVPSLYATLLEVLTPEDAKSLKIITLAGEKTTPGLIQATREIAGHIEICNEYGVTEASVMSTIFRNQEKETQVSIGRPVPNTQLYILDNRLQLQPQGVAGELCIGGDGLARGYLNNPAMTAEKFVPNPFKPGTLVYRTGDFARWRDDGTLQFFGRMDHQVKIRGFRIELGEIENQLLKIESIKEAVVTAPKKKNGESYLCAYFTADETLNVADIRAGLAERIPAYMVPASFAQLDKIPLTPTGKVDTRALPAPETRAETQYIAPQTDIEKVIARTWQEVLGIDTVGMKDNFFEIGGNSLNIMSVSVKLSQALDKEITVVNLLNYATVESLARHLKQSQGHDNTADEVKERTQARDKGRNKMLAMKKKKRELKDGR